MGCAHTEGLSTKHLPSVLQKGQGPARGPSPSEETLETTRTQSRGPGTGKGMGRWVHDGLDKAESPLSSISLK